MTISLNPDVRAKLDAHLDAVERALIAAGNTRERRRGVVDDLEAQIMDMLAGKSELPTMADLEGVLAGLDPPAAYAQGAAEHAGPGEPARVVPPMRMPPAVAPARPRYSRTAIAGLICILLSLVPLPVIAVAGWFFAVKTSPQAAYYPAQDRLQIAHAVQTSPRNVLEPVHEMPQKPVDEETAREMAQHAVQASVHAEPHAMNKGMVVGPLACILVLLAPLGLTGTVLGWIAFAQIRGSGGMLRGKGLALFDGLFYPVLVVLGGLAIIG